MNKTRLIKKYNNLSTKEQQFYINLAHKYSTSRGKGKIEAVNVYIVIQMSKSAAQGVLSLLSQSKFYEGSWRKKQADALLKFMRNNCEGNFPLSWGGISKFSNPNGPEIKSWARSSKNNKSRISIFYEEM